jgi:hypothetical protein
VAIFENILDPDVLKSGCGIAATIYGITAVAILIAAVIASQPSLRNDSRILAPILAIIAVALALIDVEFPRASETLLPILYLSVVLVLAVAAVALIVVAFRALKNRVTRIVALVAAPLPMAAGIVLVLIAYMLAHSRFCC